MMMNSSEPGDHEENQKIQSISSSSHNNDNDDNGGDHSINGNVALI
jgi:hypothetical protein